MFAETGFLRYIIHLQCQKQIDFWTFFRRSLKIENVWKIKGKLCET